MLCKLISKKKLSDNVYDFTVECPEMAEKTKPGQFVHVICGGDAYLRRPISICEVKENKYVRFIFQVRGIGTDALAQKNEGDMLDVLGPLGNGFNIENVTGKSLLIGGGIGIFPLLELAKKLGKSCSVLLGFRSKNDMMMTEEFATYAENVFVATNDGSCGFKGLVTDVLKNIVSSNKIDTIFVCGPTPMMKATASIAVEHNIPGQVSLEERMACGIGACVGCVCNINGQRKRVCKDGPVFNASEVEWDG